MAQKQRGKLLHDRREIDECYSTFELWKRAKANSVSMQAILEINDMFGRKVRPRRATTKVA